MPLHAFNSDIQFVNALALGGGDAVVIGGNGFVYGQDTLFLGQTGNDILVAGGVASWLTAFSFGSLSPVLGATIQLSHSGLVNAYQALFYNGSNLHFHNAGTIMADSIALSLLGTTGFGTASRIHNSGSIISGGTAVIYGRPGQTEPYTIHNTGVIASTSSTASSTAILFGDADVANDRLVNAGQIVGLILLGGGNDLYDGRGGGTVTGSIGGGPGDDRFRPGAAEEVFDGGSGLDTLDFRGGGGAMAIALDNAFDADGWAEGDQWTGIENVIGSRGADRIGGDSAANALHGAAGDDSISGGSNQDTLDGGDGNDTLAGGSASDTLTGGSGIDTLTGGSGNDAFLFRRLGEIGDVITDFSSAAAGNDDRIGVSQSGFGAGLALGALAASRFRARADNVAQDADDRFIFRSTDQTLWFDADGNGGGAAVLLADLQPGASLTAADIVIF